MSPSLGYVVAAGSGPPTEMLLPTEVALRAPVVVGVPLKEPCVVGEGSLRVGGVAIEVDVDIDVTVNVSVVAIDEVPDPVDVSELVEVSVGCGAANATDSTSTTRETHRPGNIVH